MAWILGGVLALAAAAHAEEWNHTYAVSGRPEMRVQTSDANIKIETWEQKNIEVHIVSQKWGFGQGGLEVIDHQTGDSVDIEVRFPHAVHVVSIGNHRVDIEVRMPREAGLRLHTGDGNIEMRNLKGEMELETGDGHISFEGIDGVIRAKTGDGRIEGKGRFDALNLHTGDGRIGVDALPGSVVGSGWELRTGDGRVNLNLPDGFAADVEMHTSDGHIDLEMPVAVQGKYAANRIEGKMNGGGGPLRIETGDGSISIGKTTAGL
jgi:hypothetical protein